MVRPVRGRGIKKETVGLSSRKSTVLVVFWPQILSLKVDKYQSFKWRFRKKVTAVPKIFAVFLELQPPLTLEISSQHGIFTLWTYPIVRVENWWKNKGVLFASFSIFRKINNYGTFSYSKSNKQMTIRSTTRPATRAPLKNSIIKNGPPVVVPNASRW